jgi:hypothetical protein
MHSTQHRLFATAAEWQKLNDIPYAVVGVPHSLCADAAPTTHPPLSLVFIPYLKAIRRLYLRIIFQQHFQELLTRACQQVKYSFKEGALYPLPQCAINIAQSTFDDNQLFSNFVIAYNNANTTVSGYL